MISDKELASNSVIRAASLRQTATALRRTVAGVQSVGAEAALSAAEVKTLATAANLLSRLADTYQAAAKRRKRAEEAREVRIEQARAAINKTFGTLSSVEDKIAFLAVMNPAVLDAARDGWLKMRLSESQRVRYLNNLLQADFNEALTLLSFDIAQTDEDVQVRTAQAWTKFREKGVAARETYIGIIELASAAFDNR